MTVKFFKSTADRRKLDKSNDIVQITSATATPWGEIDLLNPVFIVKYSDSLLNSNYVHVPLFDRYYFASITLLPGSQLRVSCYIDPLYSFLEGIKSKTVNVIRYEQQRTKYIQDNKLPKISRTNTTTKMFSENPFILGDGAFSQNVHYVLSVVGGDGSTSGGDA